MSFRPASSKLPCLTQARTFKIAKKRTMCRRRDMQCSRSPPLPLFGSPPLGINEEHNALSVLQHVGTQSGGDGVWRSLPLPHNKICHYTTTMFVPVTTSTPERLHDARRPARGVAASAFAMLRQPRLCHPGPVKTVTIVTRSFAALQVSARCCRASVRTAGTIRLCHPGANRGPGPQARRQARHIDINLTRLHTVVQPTITAYVKVLQRSASAVNMLNMTSGHPSAPGERLAGPWHADE